MMTKQELSALADRYQRKADTAFDNYQVTGSARHGRDYRNNWDLAEALRMAAEASEEHAELVALRCEISRIAGLVQELRAKRLPQAAAVNDLLLLAKLHGLIADKEVPV